MPLPTLVIAGAQKCGTSSLSATLRQHPDIFMSKPKELHFFDRRFRKGLDHYASHFTAGADLAHRGEATPVYMYDPAARRRMAETLPHAKIVVILRDPAERAYSHYWHERRLGREPLTTFEEALAAEQERRAGGTRIDRMKYSYADRGRYVDQILSLVEGHGRDNVHVMLLDDLTHERVPTLRDLLTFLDVDPAPAESVPEEWIRVPGRGRRSGEIDGHRARPKDGKTEPATYPPISPATRQFLVEEFREPNDRLAAWLGRDLSAWNKA